MTEDDQTKNAFTRIEDISAQNRPLIAGPDDTVVGFDELGGTVYRSKTGQEYTLYPETKTKQERPIVTAAKAVGEYLSDPSLPSLEETSEFAKEAVKGAYEPFRKIASGDSPTYGDLAEVLPAGLSGAATRVGKPFDTSVVSSGGAGPVEKAYRPKMFSSGEVGIKPGAYSVAEFYSPTVETLRNTEFPSKGYLGKELIKLLRDKTPGVRKAELDTMDLGIEDQKRYTKEEILDLAQRRSYKVTAEVQDADPNQDTQRQIIRDKEVDYATIKINATPASEEIDSFFPTRGYTHYDPETIAHTRVSVREDQNGAEYLLVEELQSDLLQHGAAKPRGPISTDDAYEEVLDILAEDISKEPDFKDLYENNQKYFDNLFKVGAENSRQYSLRERGIPVPQEELDNYNALVEETRGMADNLGEAPYEKGFQRLATFLENAGYEEGYRIERRTKAIGPSPLTETSDAVRLTLQAAMAKAADSDVKSLVIPNVQRIIAADRARPGSEEYEKYVQPGSGFQRTYVKGVEKFIKQLQSEYGDAIKVERVELPYIKEKLYYQGQELDVPNTAIKIDFSGLKDVDLRVGRFAEGGMVEEDQMRRLMQEGGMTDDGMSIEPVTGNEIPPGSLASEVRDDIPAQLSEGEYIVPADVVRFFGVRFFEDLRNQAKQGLAEMDADGRIGGAAVDAQGIPAGEGDEELTPEEQEMLMEVLGGGVDAPAGMAYGGMVEQPMTNPYQDQTTLYQMPEGLGGPVGMAEGGMVRGGDTTFDRTQFTIPDSTGAFESRKYINTATGEERTIQFLNGLPMGLIPEGFVPWTPALAEQATKGTQTPAVKAPSVTPVQVSRGEGPGADRAQPTTGEGSMGNWGKENYDAFTSDPYGFAVNSFNDASKNSLGFLGKTAIGGLIGDVEKVKAIGVINAALDRVQPNSPQATDLQNKLDSLTGSLQSPLAGALTGVGIMGSGNAFSKQIEAEAARRGSSTPSTAPSTPSKSVSTGTATGGGGGKAADKELSFGGATAGKSVSTGTVSTGGQKESLGFGSATAGKTASVSSTSGKGLSMGTPAGSKTAGSTTSGGLSMGTPAGGGKSTGGSSYGGGISGGANEGRRATGGLVSKKGSSKSKSKKGLAS